MVRHGPVLIALTLLPAFGCAMAPQRPVSSAKDETLAARTAADRPAQQHPVADTRSRDPDISPHVEQKIAALQSRITLLESQLQHIHEESLWYRHRVNERMHSQEETISRLRQSPPAVAAASETQLAEYQLPLPDQHTTGRDERQEPQGAREFVPFEARPIEVQQTGRQPAVPQPTGRQPFSQPPQSPPTLPASDQSAVGSTAPVPPREVPHAAATGWKLRRLGESDEASVPQ